MFSHMVGNTGLLHILAHATCLESTVFLTAEMAPRDTDRVGMLLRGITEVSLVFMSRLPLRMLKYWFRTAGATHTGVPWETSQILFFLHIRHSHGVLYGQLSALEDRIIVDPVGDVVDLQVVFGEEISTAYAVDRRFFWYVPTRGSEGPWQMSSSHALCISGLST